MLMRVHYIATDLTTQSSNTYRQNLLEIWDNIRPDRPANAQLLSNRVRWILKNQKLSRAELDVIRSTCFPHVLTDPHTIDVQELTSHKTPPKVRRSGLFVRREHHDVIEKSFMANVMRFSGITPEKRPKIPRMQHSRDVLESVNHLNAVLPKHLENIDNLRQMVDVVYAGAATICEIHGRGVEQLTTSRPPFEPPWKMRLEKSIVMMRKKIGSLHTYLNTPNPSSKLTKTVRKLASEFRVRRRDPLFREKISVVCDTLKQKIKALGNRIRRYNERVKRHKNNKTFFQNQKQFFRDLEQNNISTDVHVEPRAAHQFWSDVWSENSIHDERANWIDEAQSKIPRVEMREINITERDIKDALKGSNNWATPGSDKIHNYWWKYLTNVHHLLAKLLQEALSDPARIPEFFTSGITYLIPKDGDLANPKNYRPITCLPSVYKILTAVLTKNINKHLRDNDLMAREQNGGRIRSKGCKELLVIDHILTKQAQRKLRNISMAWVDYRKAFDSVPHSWLLKVLRMHGICEQIINLLESLMRAWRTALLVRSGDRLIESTPIKIKRGIFQGDTLSPIWFCLALNPLSMLLNNTKYGYTIDKTRNTRISHSLYMDDLKLYASSSEQLRRQLEMVSVFSESISMQMGIEKCAVIEVKRGKIQDSEQHTTLMSNVTIPTISKNESYKYLGIRQALDIKTSEMKQLFRQKLYQRVNLLLKSKLNSRSLFTAINIWAIPSITYSFGVLTWSVTELREMDRALRALLTKYGMHHPHASSIRLYLPRQHGGRGLLNLETTHGENIEALRRYFLGRNSPFFMSIREADRGFSALKLSQEDYRVTAPSMEEMLERLDAKPLHGRYSGHLKQKDIDRVESLTYLRAGYLFPETEGRLMAIQDQVSPTRMYLKHIAKQDIPSDRCRRCSQAPESIQHITSSCPILAPQDYLSRHNAMARIYHQQMAIKIGLLKDEIPQHLYQPKTLLQNGRYRLYWDATLITDRGVAHNRPDITLFDTSEETCLLLDITVPADDNVSKAYTEKITKYTDLAFQLRELYNLKAISILPLIISVNGLVEKHLPENTERLCLEKNIISTAQKQVILGTIRTVRRFLQNP